MTQSGFTLYESRAICRYLCLANPSLSHLVPSSNDAEASALFEQAASIEALNFNPPAGRLAFEKFAKRFMGLPADEGVVAQAAREVEGFFEVAEGWLAGREYMAGDEFTLVDLFYVPLVQRLFACGYGDLVTERKAVGAWWGRCVAREGVARMLAADKEAAAKAAAAAK